MKDKLKYMCPVFSLIKFFCLDSKNLDGPHKWAKNLEGKICGSCKKTTHERALPLTQLGI